MNLPLSPDALERLERFVPKACRHAQPTPLERATEHLARLVLGYRVAPGQKIPLDDIAAHIGTSRTPVREALRLLETEGLVVALPHRGFIVGRMDAAQVAQLYEARGCIESFVARESFRKRTPAFLKDLRSLHRIYTGLLGGSGDRRRLGMLADKAFHVRIAEQAGNPYLTALLSNMFDRLILTRPLEDFPLDRMGEAVAEHAQLLAQLESGTARGVEAAMARNVQNGGAAIVAHMQSTAKMFSPA
jgi:DNA-binding GntR family transcriptional regulator